ncbi:MAG: cupin domain-containing protein [Chloroflexi bacterium]|nr:cupin domain-containing protein [Chloroflexota bacterium]
MVVDPTGSVAALSFFDQECEPGVGAGSHTHEFEEILTVVDGTAEVWSGSVRYTVGPGASVFVPIRAVHGFRNVGTSTLRLQAIIASNELSATFVQD